MNEQFANAIRQTARYNFRNNRRSGVHSFKKKIRCFIMPQQMGSFRKDQYKISMVMYRESVNDITKINTAIAPHVDIQTNSSVVCSLRVEAQKNIQIQTTHFGLQKVERWKWSYCAGIAAWVRRGRAPTGAGAPTLERREPPPPVHWPHVPTPPARIHR